MKMMFSSSFKKLLLLRIGTLNPKTHHQHQHQHQNPIYFLQRSSFNSKHPSSPPPPPNSSLCEALLIDSCGLSSKQAAETIHKHFNGELEKPRSVISCLETNGFSKPQISKIVSTLPRLLFLNPERNIEPKIRVFKDLGLSDSKVTSLITSNPRILARSLRTHIISKLNVIRGCFLAEETFLDSINDMAVLLGSCNHNIEENIAHLRENGVSNGVFDYLMNMRYCTRVLRANPQVFKRVVENIKGYGLEPQSRRFAVALSVMYSMSKSTWDSKIDMLKSLGWSQEQIFELFRRAPVFMAYSAEKLKEGIKYYEKHLNWDASVTSKYPRLLMFNIERRVIPRYVVFKILMSKGIVKKDSALVQMLNLAEKDFLRKYVVKYQDEIPDLLEKYKNAGMVSRGKERKLPINSIPHKFRATPL